MMQNSVGMICSLALCSGVKGDATETFIVLQNISG